MVKEIKIKYFFILLTCMFLTFCIAGILLATPEVRKDAGDKGDKIVARVNGQPIYEGALTPYVKRELRKFQKYGAKRDTTALEKRLKRRALDAVVSLELIKQESQKLKIKDMDGKVDEKLKELKNRYQSERKYKDFLKTKGRTESDVKESIKSKIYVEEYLEVKGIKNPKVPEEEIRKYYEKNKESFRRKEYLQVSHILVMVKEDAKAEENEQAKAKAERIRKEIIEGRDFAETAKEYSEDGKASQGGDLGYIERGYMPPEFDEVAFSLEKGKISYIVQTKHGYHIIKVLDRKPEGIAPYEDVRDFIGKYLQEGLVRTNRASHIKELKSKAEIEILLNES
ncbi:MAG: peptidylprolyl isomerase [Nitrospirota bacterium]